MIDKVKVLCEVVVLNLIAMDNVVVPSIIIAVLGTIVVINMILMNVVMDPIAVVVMIYIIVVVKKAMGVNMSVRRRCVALG